MLWNYVTGNSSTAWNPKMPEILQAMNSSEHLKNVFPRMYEDNRKWK